MKLRAMKLAAKDLSLDESVLDLLRAINRDVRVFTPDDGTPEALARFQEVVKLIRMMESRRYIAVITSLNLLAAGGGQSQVDKVRLSGGLTEKGRAVLAYYDGEAQEEYLNYQSA
jgi:hypothetical protein